MKNEKKGICLLCGSTAELKHNGYPGYQEHDIFEIYYCLSCNTTFSIPRIEADAIYENIYKNKNKSTKKSFLLFY